MPFRKLFLSRWAALLWAGGILWTAVDTVGFGPAAKAPHDAANATGVAGDSDATGATVNSDDLAVLAAAINAQ